MTGKDLLLVVLVAGVAGAGAGIGATLANPGPAPDAAADLASRLDRIENALAKAGESEKEARESVAKLSDRITGLQMDIGALKESAGAADVGDSDTAAAATETRPGRAKRIRLPEGQEVEVATSTGEIVTEDGVRLVTRPTFALGGAIADEAGARLRTISEGLRLRMLPEAERWKKAQEDLHLTDAQVEAIKGAVAERDRAFKDAMQVETSNDAAGNTRLTFRRMDPAKAVAAKEDFDKRVTDALDADQEKTWKEKGYDHAFGGAGGGTAVVLSAQTIEMTTEDGKPQK
jgi:hypothetical protein